MLMSLAGMTPAGPLVWISMINESAARAWRQVDPFCTTACESAGRMRHLTPPTIGGVSCKFLGHNVLHSICRGWHIGCSDSV
jgi:hypothetical protein